MGPKFDTHRSMKHNDLELHLSQSQHQFLANLKEFRFDRPSDEFNCRSGFVPQQLHHHSVCIGASDMIDMAPSPVPENVKPKAVKPNPVLWVTVVLVVVIALCALLLLFWWKRRRKREHCFEQA